MTTWGTSCGCGCSSRPGPFSLCPQNESVLMCSQVPVDQGCSEVLISASACRRISSFGGLERCYQEVVTPLETGFLLLFSWQSLLWLLEIYLMVNGSLLPVLAEVSMVLPFPTHFPVVWSSCEPTDLIKSLKKYPQVLGLSCEVIKHLGHFFKLTVPKELATWLIKQRIKHF